MLKQIAHFLIRRAEKRLKVTLDYVHQIANTDIGLLSRYNKIFGFLDPNKNVPPLAYHTARLRGAISGDCGTCVEAEINLALNAKINSELIDQILIGDYTKLSTEIRAVAELSDCVTGAGQDNLEARDAIKKAFGDAGLIEVCCAMNGAALLPNIKRSMGYATGCDIEILRKTAIAKHSQEIQLEKMS